MEKITALLVLLSLLSFHFHATEPAFVDCYSMCSAGGVKKDTGGVEQCINKCLTAYHAGVGLPDRKLADQGPAAHV